MRSGAEQATSLARRGACRLASRDLSMARLWRRSEPRAGAGARPCDRHDASARSSSNGNSSESKSKSKSKGKGKSESKSKSNRIAAGTQAATAIATSASRQQCWLNKLTTPRRLQLSCSPDDGRCAGRRLLCGLRLRRRPPATRPLPQARQSPVLLFCCGAAAALLRCGVNQYPKAANRLCCWTVPQGGQPRVLLDRCRTPRQHHTLLYARWCGATDL